MIVAMQHGTAVAPFSADAPCHHEYPSPAQGDISMTVSNRREFIQQSGIGLAGGVAAVALAGQARADENDKPVVALIGTGGMGNAHLQQLAGNNGVRLAYVCDVDQGRLDAAVKSAESLSGTAPTAVTDMRRVFDDKAVDAVWIATPDHWHAPAAILAADAGKHVYVEKPCSHNIREGRLMIEAAKRNNRVMQVGTQSRSTAHVMQAMQRLRDGVIGDVLVSKAWNSQRRGNIGHQQPGDPPAGLDYDAWIGPAPMVPYQSNLLPGIWRWWYAFGTGDMGNDGVHDLDIARWGLGVETHPSRIAALGGKFFFDDDQQFPDTQYVVFEYPGDGQVGHKRQLIFEQRIWSPYVQEGYENGNAYYGTKGMMILGKIGGYKIYGERNKLIEEGGPGTPDLPAHHQNFLACCREGGAPHADININFLSSSLCHLGNIATRVGRVVNFDPQTEQVIGDDEANALVRRQYRDGHWAVPQGV
jgi:predicted dehydrogenase